MKYINMTKLLVLSLFIIIVMNNGFFHINTVQKSEEDANQYYEENHLSNIISSNKITAGSATLTGTFFDYGLDENLDGKCEYLVIEIEINVITSGTYRVDVWGLKDNSGNTITVSDYNNTHLNPGIQRVNLYLAGQAIFGQGLDPSQVISIDLHDDQGNLLGELDYQSLSKTYAYSDFIVTATLTGSFTDFGLDTDSDGKYNFLIMDILVNISISGTYRVDVWGLKDNSGNTITVSDYNSTYLDDGIKFVRILLPSQAIRGQGLDPSQVISIDLHDDQGNLLGELDYQPLSKTYTYSDFNGLAELSGKFYDYVIDMNSDGKYEYLAIEIEVNVTVSGTYRVDVWGLKDNSGNTITVSDYNSTYLDAGIQRVILYLVGQAIFGQGLDPSQVISIDLHDDQGNLLGELDYQPLSKTYAYSDFIVTATLTGSFTDSGLDENLDNVYDRLFLSIEINVTVPETYRVDVWGLKDNSGNTITVSDYNSTYLDAGIQKVNLYLSGQAIYGQGLDPSQVISIDLHDDQGNLLGELDYQPLSQTYLHSHFGNEFLITNPTNSPYNNNNIWLNFTINFATNWIGFSLDEAPNVTIFDNVLLTNLAEGVHTVVLFAQDINDNYFSSIPIWFTIDTIAPILTANNPSNETYSTNYIDVNASVNELTSWIGYSIDDGINTTLLKNNNIVYLPDGSHTIIFYAIDLAGNEVKSSENSFTIDTQSPVISISNPQNDYYNYQSHWVNFTINEPTDWIGYKLDNQAIVTINGNFFLQDLPEGDHALTLYANDSLGFLGNSEIKFTIDITPPIITILKPENITYISQEIEINFIISEPASFIYYSLDGKSNVSITEVLSLSISEGEHFIVMYASDRAGNVNKSEKIWFTLEYPPNPPTHEGSIISPLETIVTQTVTINHKCSYGWSRFIDGGTQVRIILTSTDSIDFFIIDDTGYKNWRDGTGLWHKTYHRYPQEMDATFDMETSDTWWFVLYNSADYPEPMERTVTITIQILTSTTTEPTATTTSSGYSMITVICLMIALTLYFKKRRRG